jgi:hypothetical protein
MKLAKIRNFKWPPGYCKHGQILLKFGIQVSIGYDIIENGNRVTGN